MRTEAGTGIVAGMGMWCWELRRMTDDTYSRAIHTCTVEMYVCHTGLTPLHVRPAWTY